MFHRAFFIVFSIAFAAQTIGEATAQSGLPDRRAVLTNNIDHYGADLTPLFDTSFDACRTACLTNPACRAFTYNTRSNACFPKSSVSDEVPYDGAQSARILPTDASVLSQADARENDLSFLGEATMTAAHDLAIRIGGLHNAGTWPVEQMLNASRDRMGEGDPLNAMRWMGAAVSLTDAADQWVEYARLLMLQPDDTNRYTARAISAATNGYLRAQGRGGQVSSLMMLAETLEANGRGRDTVAALRLANALSPRDDVVAALESATAKYGFRITENTADNDAANPRLCAIFSEDLIQTGTDYTPFVQLPDAGLVVQVEGRQLCIDGLSHGARYSVTFRSGLPAANGEALLKDVQITQYIRDRAPSVVFPGRAYVLPRAADAALPIETVNLAEVDLTLRRVSDRNLLRAIQDDYFGRPLTDYELSEFSEEIATDIWTGVGEVQNQLNQTMTTRLPMGEVLADQPPGIYALTARIEGMPLYDDPGATQWFVLSDLGLTTLKGTDGLHVFARGLGDARSIEGAEITLLSRANEVLGTAMTDDMGHAIFAPGLTRGTGGAAPAMVLVETDAGEDMAFLSLTDPAFDLSDRGVEGRPPAPPVDVFLATDRGAYRAGEVIHATALARDTLARAIPGLPLTAILMRPDGVEYSRHLSAEDRAGGHVFALPITETAPRGTWALEIRADMDAPALASTRLLVEDFLPERIDFDLTLPDGMLRRDAPGAEGSAIGIDARYLFGAPGAGLKADGSMTLTPQRRLPDFPGFAFGRHDAPGTARVSYLETVTTGPDGAASLPLTLPDTGESTLPQEARATIAVREGSGRPVERGITRLLAPSGPFLGIKPAQNGVIPEGGTATFDVIALGTDLEPMAMEVDWSLSRVTTTYQWYQQWGNWNWEPITRRERVANGTLTLDGAQTISAPVGWGEYELSVERTDGTYTAASTTFYAGWYTPADATSTPDTLELSLDKPAYATGETAQLRLVPRYAGTALITVLSNRVIDMQAVEVSAGAYVTAQIIRPMDVAIGQNPARSLGLAHAMIDPGARTLSVEIAAPETSDPRGPLEAVVTVDGLNGADGFVTLAAVDLGILNLTGFATPDPEAHYFGQRRLGVEIRDIYGRLTQAEAALLVALPQSPETRRPDRHHAAATAARARVLGRMEAAGVLSTEAATAALFDPVPAQRRAFPALAPHLTDRALAEASDKRLHALTIDAVLQSRIETLAATRLRDLPETVSIAIVIADHQTGAIRASLGSAGYAPGARAGFVDMTQALRSPGSTLKPLIYGMGFDRGLAHPQTLIRDAPVQFGSYAPQNFDGRFRGDVTVQSALRQSLNIPVVLLMDEIGPAHLMDTLRRAGIHAEVPGGRAGLAVALGGVGMSLEGLVQLYGGIARGGDALALHHRAGDTPASARILSPSAAWHISDILAGLAPPPGAPARSLAYKTGTSYGHRDAWAIGYDGRHVAGVWIGRPDGTPLPGAFGGDLAAPLLFEAFQRLETARTPLPAPPAETLLLSTQELPRPLRRFAGRETVFAPAADAPKLIFPPDGAELMADGPLTIKLRDGKPPFTLMANGAPVLTGLYRRDAELATLGTGFSDLTVIDALGRTAHVTVRLRDTP
ncbi:hypothetical protein KUD11_04095 [Roseovarius sp. LXJ103]|uniref:MG2 domain-containing protein n=1 Tax=Roseovarius carneus TaxID=2853164 RepID=UPI000D619A20|nr:MG2 domain-containing protein [Roseovarius carneus]MBZ8117820.1 hypothetical protein [Roseovarius carneus]PWE36416.1 hypothetical protein DD563_10865 [Pelagicola sp. LXJ1103]